MNNYQPSSWKSELISDQDLAQNQQAQFQGVLDCNPGLEDLLEGVVAQNSADIFTAAETWNSSQINSGEGEPIPYNFGFRGNDNKLENFTVNAYEDGCVLISLF